MSPARVVNGKRSRALLALLLAVSFAGCANLDLPAASLPGKAGKAGKGGKKDPPAASVAGQKKRLPKDGQRLRRVQPFKRRGPLAGAAGRKETPLDALDKPDASSLWSDRSPFLFVDRRAARVGDIITVIINESSNAKKEADTEIQKNSTLRYTIPAIPGFGEPLAAPSGRARRFDPNDTLRATSLNQSDAETEIELTDSLKATVSARVMEVLPNGNLMIEGRREIITNEETLIITVSGLVRPEDIGADNTVQSKFLADAKIVYAGEGAL
ncbi:MAG: flagellar basal body L-ring protein FlgH, partial [bacterium]